jgi:hypothetical protein
MSSQYRVCSLFWNYHKKRYSLRNEAKLEDLLNDGWKIIRVDTMSPTNFPAGAFGATNVYVLEKQSEEKQSEDTKKSSVSEPLPHDMGLRMKFLPHDMGLCVELDTSEVYYLKSGWAERCDGIYGLACGYVDCSEDITWFKDPSRIAIMNNHVKLAVPWEGPETETTKQTEDTNVRETGYES